MGRRWVSIGLVCLIISAGMLGFFAFESEVATASVLYVGGGGFGNFTTIQSAVNAAVDGDTIYVYNGTYYEHVVVNKIINLTGEDRDTTIIDGLGSGDVVRVEADWVNITGFTVTGSGSDPVDSGIELDNVQNCRINNNNVSSNNWYGIHLYYSDENTVTDNNASNNHDGIRLLFSNKNNITGNTVSLNDQGINLEGSGECKINDNNALNNKYGIRLSSSIENIITDNNFSSNTRGIHLYFASNGNNINRNNVSNNGYTGMEIAYSYDNTITDNNIFSNDEYGVHIRSSIEINMTNNTMIEDGIFIEGDSLEYWNTHHIDTSNTVNGKPVYYWKNQTGGTIPPGAAEVILANCTNVIVENQELTNGTVGIELGFSFINHIIGNNASSNSRHGIYLYSSNGNNITGNNLFSNYWGMELRDSLENKILSNNISYNGYGIWLEFSDRNTLITNNVTNNYDGICIRYSNGNTILRNNVSSNDRWGIILDDSHGNFITNNNVSSNNWEGIAIMDSSGNFITSNNVSLNNDKGIYLLNSDSNFITSNHVSRNNVSGISLWNSNGITVTDNNISSNDNYGMDFKGASSNIIDNCTITNNPTGVHFDEQSVANTFVNCSISNSGMYDFYFDNASGGDSHATTLNTTFDKTKVYYEDTLSDLVVMWFMHVKVIYYNRTPVKNAEIWVNDTYGTNIINGQTDSNGWKKWIIVTEYIEQDVNGDNIGERTYFTPHIVTATDGELWGKAHPEPNMNKSKTVTVILGNYTSINLYPGWNLISLPRIQTYPALKTVLHSIEGDYDAVQYFNITDKKDQWKHHHISKPQDLNDLEKIKHPMGFWIHVTNPNGTTLLVYGDIFSSPENIPLYIGWNQVGFPSLSNKNTTAALNNLVFGVEVDSIWAFDAATQTWENVGPTDSFILGKGYWIHATQDCTWQVPL